MNPDQVLAEVFRRLLRHDGTAVAIDDTYLTLDIIGGIQITEWEAKTLKEEA